jgi:Holliday junction resolvasome RuvABC DNA-binding subunit
MSNLVSVIVNALTGETTEVELTFEELAQWEADKAASEAQQAEQKAKEAARQTALDKLAALGLTPEEISAITGA